MENEQPHDTRIAAKILVKIVVISEKILMFLFIKINALFFVSKSSKMSPQNPKYRKNMQHFQNVIPNPKSDLRPSECDIGNY
jgi:hypothetical protein